MAEGHAVVRWARRLRGLVEQPLVRVHVPARYAEYRDDFLGEHVLRVDTHGKHLLIRTSAGLSFHCHALMVGSWQFGAPGMPLRKPEARVRLRLASRRFEAVFFNGPVMEILSPDEERQHRSLSHLGPDVMHDDFNADEAWRRLQLQPELELGDAVLRQEIVAGIGNIYKSEALFMARLPVQMQVGHLARGAADDLWRMAGELMWDDARRSGPIVTLPANLRRGGERHWVYRRRTKPCRWCATPVQMVRQGPLRRTTYFCPGCQPLDSDLAPIPGPGETAPLF